MFCRMAPYQETTLRVTVVILQFITDAGDGKSPKRQILISQRLGCLTDSILVHVNNLYWLRFCLFLKYC